MLYIVPTPVGNMEDITLRALRVLREADLVLAEDTRTTGILLKHHGIQNRLMSHHKFNEHGTSAAVVERLLAGETIALVSDAGTPGISDPGFFLVREAVKAGVEVQTLPGATAFVPALVSSGLPCDRFCFEGFLPQKKGRHTAIENLRDEQRTMVFYESPHRLLKALQQFAEVFGSDRQASVAREISKVHEQHVRGTLAELIAHFTDTEPRGEIVIIVAGKPKKAAGEAKAAERLKRAKTALLCLMAVILLLPTSCREEKKDPVTVMRQVEQNDSLKDVLARRDKEINDMMATMSQIQRGFNEISEAEGRVAIAKDGEGTNQAEQMKQDIQFIADRMQLNRELLKKLQGQLRQSHYNGEEMKSALTAMMEQMTLKDQQLQRLQAELEAKDIHIAELDETISGLNDDVTALRTESDEKTQTIKGQETQLNTAWYVFGTKKELKQQGVMQDGSRLAKNFNKGYFTRIDIRVTNEIRLYSKSVQLITPHPTGSYELTTDRAGQYVLHITNPQSFWSASKYLVIVVK